VPRRVPSSLAVNATKPVFQVCTRTVNYTQIVKSSRIPGNERQKYCLNPPVFDLGDQIIAESRPIARSILDLLINTNRFALLPVTKEAFQPFSLDLNPRRGQFVPESSSLCVFYQDPYLRPTPRKPPQLLPYPKALATLLSKYNTYLIAVVNSDRSIIATKGEIICRTNNRDQRVTS
jgi:hypothetical protein